MLSRSAWLSSPQALGQSISPPSPYANLSRNIILCFPRQISLGPRQACRVPICDSRDGMFEMDAERNWTYVDGKTKARLIHTNRTYNELLEIAYEATSLNPNQFQIKMKFIVRSCYKLDPIEIENDGDVKCFFKEHFRGYNDTSPLFIEVEALQDTPPTKEQRNGERDSDPAIPFASSGRIDFQRRYQ
ncbi:hypothetical protein FNV43_RR02610 [Rhamnella rubrinervis]|uniref:Uncharacterized protein n=1 Tax=Rhamnella rubrinervis TaxID=2594499 RepID=A0A8K0HTT1_9ROSA|nr:hypothetical protein FNV43_RR02610 [Rhamnella rubrinervis]